MRDEKARRKPGFFRRARAVEPEVKLATFVMLLAVSAAAFVLFPASMPATTYAGPVLTDDAYRDLERELLDYARANAAAGVRAHGEPNEASSLSLSCRNVLLLLLMRAPQVTLVQVSLGAEHRAPAFGELVDALVARAGVVKQPDANFDEIRASNRFILEHRDGIDLDAECAL